MSAVNLTYGWAWEGSGYAIVGTVSELTVTANGALSLQMESVHLYISA